MKLLKILTVLLFGLQAVWATSLTFTFANGVVTNNGSKKYEFDVMAAADNDTTRLGDALVYINYSTLGFGASIYANSKITVEKGTLLQGELVAGLPLYEISNILPITPIPVWPSASAINIRTVPLTETRFPHHPHS